MRTDGIVTDENTYRILYKVNWYNLEQNKPIIVDWGMLSNLSLDMQKCMDKIIRSQKMYPLSEILDPSIPPNECGYEMHDVNQFYNFHYNYKTLLLLIFHSKLIFSYMSSP